MHLRRPGRPCCFCTANPLIRNHFEASALFCSRNCSCTNPLTTGARLTFTYVEEDPHNCSLLKSNSLISRRAQDFYRNMAQPKWKSSVIVASSVLPQSRLLPHRHDGKAHWIICNDCHRILEHATGSFRVTIDAVQSRECMYLSDSKITSQNCH